MNEAKKQTARSRGRFITIEGIEGVGKTSNIDFVDRFLNRHGVESIVTREPGGTDLGRTIRQLLLDPGHSKMATDSELLLMFADRAQHLDEVIRPALAGGRWVICDRFVDATYAYQGGGRQVAMDRITQLEEWIVGKTRPDLTLLLDAPVGLALQRANQRSAPDRFESERAGFFERVRSCYLERAGKEPQRIKIIDAGQALMVVQDQIKAVLEEFIGHSSEHGHVGA